VTLPPGVADALAAALGVAVSSAEPIAGGDLNEAWRVGLGDGRLAFVKSRAGAAGEEFHDEAAGLRWLADAGALRAPAVLAVGPDAAAGAGPYLALEWVAPGRLDDSGREALGRGLAALHLAGAESFGAPPGASGPTRLGPVVLPNDPADDWPSFYAASRLEPLVRRAADQGALSAAGARAVQDVCERLPELAGPAELPARLHGDLWSGNVHASADGQPWLIDPAAYGGHREVDLAMLRLFGDPGPRVLGAYQELAPLAPGHEERVALWQMLPLLVHAVLFGGGYGAAVERAANTLR
jgi:fructosamine-3-kinase